MYTRFKMIVVVSLLFLTSLNSYGQQNPLLSKLPNLDTVGKALVRAGNVTFQKASDAVDSIKVGAVNSYNYADTSSTFKTMYNDGKEALKVLAGLFKTSVEKVFYVMVKQQYMLGFIDLAKFLVLFAVLIWISTKVKRAKAEDQYGLQYDAFRVIQVVYLIVFIMNTINVYIPSMCQHFINPEYPVYLQIMDMISQLRK